MQAHSASPCCGSGTPTTCTSSTFGWRNRNSSTSRGETTAPRITMLFMAVSSAFGVALAHLQVLLGGVLAGLRLHHRTQQRRVGQVPAGAVVPARAVPGVDAVAVRALVVAAGRGERLHHSFDAQRLDAGGVDVQVLEAPAHLLAGERLRAEPALR